MKSDFQLPLEGLPICCYEFSTDDKKLGVHGKTELAKLV